jgi:hypothetical protein
MQWRVCHERGLEALSMKIIGDWRVDEVEHCGKEIDLPDQLSNPLACR